MNRKLTVILIGATLLLMLCSCDSEEVKQAKEDFAAGHYTEVIKTLDGQENLSQEAQDMLAISGANVAYENEDYLVAVKTLITASTGIQTGQFEEMFNAALDDAIRNKSADDVIELLSLDESKADTVYHSVTKLCKDMDYSGFILLDRLIKKLNKGELRTKLKDFDKDNDILRAKAFMLGKWKETDEQGLGRTIEVTLSGDNMIGIIVKIDDDTDYKKNDVYWEDFNFLDRKRLTCNSISKGYEGDTNDNKAVGTINYKKGTLMLHLTPTSDHGLTYYDTNWKRNNR